MMTIGIFIFITACVLSYSLIPLLGRKQSWPEVADSGNTRRTLEAEKESYLRAMKDIEFEHASNKINDQDYADLRKHYGAKAAKTIREIDELPDEVSEELQEQVEQVEQDDQPALSNKQRKAMESDIADVQDKLAILEHDWDAGMIDDDEYDARYDEYTQELESLMNKSAEEQV